MGAWALLIMCIVAEVIATSLLKNSNGFAQPLYGILSIVIFAGCLWAPSYGLTRIPVGVAYAIWQEQAWRLCRSSAGQSFVSRYR